MQKLKNPPQSERTADAHVNFQGFKSSLPKATADDLRSVISPLELRAETAAAASVSAFLVLAGACVGELKFQVFESPI